MSDRKGTVGDLKRALANIPDDVYVIIPQDSDDGGRSYWAYWNGDPKFFHPIRVENTAATWGYMDMETPYTPWDDVVYLTEGDEFISPQLGSPPWIVYVGMPCKSGLDGTAAIYPRPVGGRFDEQSAIVLYDEIIAAEPYPQRPIRLVHRPGSILDEVTIRRNDGQEDL